MTRAVGFVSVTLAVAFLLEAAGWDFFGFLAGVLLAELELFARDRPRRVLTGVTGAGDCLAFLFKAAGCDFTFLAGVFSAELELLACDRPRLDLTGVTMAGDCLAFFVDVEASDGWVLRLEARTLTVAPGEETCTVNATALGAGGGINSSAFAGRPRRVLGVIDLGEFTVVNFVARVDFFGTESAGSTVRGFFTLLAVASTDSDTCFRRLAGRTTGLVSSNIFFLV